MKKRSEPQFLVSDDKREYTCILTLNNKQYIGKARCHDGDLDMLSEKTGCEIAFRRAVIQAQRNTRDELKQQLKILNHLYHSMKRSKHFNENSYENRMLQRHIHLTKFDLDAINTSIAEDYENLRAIIAQKDHFYNMIRANRKKAEK